MWHRKTIFISSGHSAPIFRLGLPLIYINTWFYHFIHFSVCLDQQNETDHYSFVIIVFIVWPNKSRQVANNTSQNLKVWIYRCVFDACVTLKLIKTNTLSWWRKIKKTSKNEHGSSFYFCFYFFYLFLTWLIYNNRSH